jgi:hypothetical protein
MVVVSNNSFRFSAVDTTRPTPYCSITFTTNNKMMRRDNTRSHQDTSPRRDAASNDIDSSKPQQRFSDVLFCGSFSESVEGGQRKSTKSELLLDSDGTFKFFETAEDPNYTDKPEHTRRLRGHWHAANGEANFDVERVDGDCEDVNRHFSVPLRQLQGTDPLSLGFASMPLMASHVPDFLRLM